MKRWTTPEELTWLNGKLLGWGERSKNLAVTDWLTTATNEFVAAFPSRKSLSHEEMYAKLKWWFYHHSKTTTAPKPPTANVSLKPPRKPSHLTQVQAYSRIFCQEGSKLHTDLNEKWKVFVKGDKTYSHLFPGKDPTAVKFLYFQQAMLKEMVPTFTQDELREVQDYIENRLKEDTEIYDKLWKAMKVDESQTETDLLKQYEASVIDELPGHFNTVLDQVKKASNFNTFLMTGGPCVMGTASLRIFSIQNGRSVNNGQTFEEFLGPLLKTLKDKYWEWLMTTYTPRELLRQPKAQNAGTDPTPTLPSSTAGSSPNVASTPVSSSPPSRPQSPTMTESPAVFAASLQSALSAPTPPAVLADAPPSTLPVTTIRSPSITPPSPTVAQPSPTVAQPSPTVAPPSPTVAPPPTQDSAMSEDLCLPSSIVPPSSNTLNPQDDDGDWPPQYTPTWKLGPQHPSYVHAAKPFLIAVPGGPEWVELLERWVTFESLSSADPVPGKLPTKPRPSELGWWFQIGRRLYERKNMPNIKSIEEFEGLWVQWWTAAQPKWRDTGSWPFSQDEVAGDWGTKLSSGGKDGLFLIVMSLGWWARASDPAVECKLRAAINDISWVMKQLNTSISARAIARPSSPDPPAPSLRRQKQHPTSEKPSGKHPRV